MQSGRRAGRTCSSAFLFEKEGVALWAYGIGFIGFIRMLQKMKRNFSYSKLSAFTNLLREHIRVLIVLHNCFCRLLAFSLRMVVAFPACMLPRLSLMQQSRRQSTESARTVI